MIRVAVTHEGEFFQRPRRRPEVLHVYDEDRYSRLLLRWLLIACPGMVLPGPRTPNTMHIHVRSGPVKVEGRSNPDDPRNLLPPYRWENVHRVTVMLPGGQTLLDEEVSVYTLDFRNHSDKDPAPVREAIAERLRDVLEAAVGPPVRIWIQANVTAVA